MKNKSEARKKLSKRIIALIVCGAIILSICLFALGLEIAFLIHDATAKVWTPSYEKLSEEELKALYDKEDYTERDLQILFEQTGLTEVGIRRAKAKSGGWQRVLKIQNQYFTEREVENRLFAPFICTDTIKEYSTSIYLEKGDILITSSTHLSGWRIGHSAVAVNETHVFQATQIGEETGVVAASSMFNNRLDFMIVRIKPEVFSSDGKNVADEAYRTALNDAVNFMLAELKGAKYNPVTGIFTDKNKCVYTSCSHLIWYGYKHFDDINGGARNIDLDVNGGLLVMPKDISLSPYVELVQTFGFNPEVMYP